jgi:primosomal protein N' (replication factor Y)
VLVPLGSRVLTGCVVGHVDGDQVDAAANDIKDVVDVLDSEPFLPGPIVDLALWVADYYMSGAGDAIAAAMPPLARVQSEGRVELTDAGRSWRGSGPKARVIELLAETGPMGVRELAAALKRRDDGGPHRSPPRGIHATVSGLARDGLVTIGRVLRGRASGFRRVTVASLSADGAELSGGSGMDSAELSSAAKSAIAALQHAPDGLPFPALRRAGVSAPVIKRLAARGLVRLRLVKQERDPFRSPEGAELASAAIPRRQVELTLEQRAALEQLEQFAAEREFRTTVLHGVTGSGKTEIYLRLAHTVSSAGRGVIVLVPEIALTPSVVTQFRASFGDRVAIQHSGLSDGERHDQWQRIRSGAVDIVVGTRSAVFAPLPSLGLIVVDEEHDGSYKQDEAPRYHARDVAVVRAKRAGALVVLGSATPSLESFQNAEAGRYRLVTLERRVMDRPLARVRVVDMRAEYAAEGPDVILSRALRDAIAGRLERNEQAVVLLNRRGYAVAVFCRQCGATAECPNCSVTLTVHRAAKRARCHYCNFSMPIPKTCTACLAPYIEQRGFGTERVEAELAAHFPAARIARLDRDTVRRRGAIVEILGRVARRSVDVLVGTQMIAKGHDFPGVSLVGVVSADVGLGLADFRAAERTFQLLTQVAGRAGRGEIPGEAIVQTLYPEHYSVRFACRQDYGAFFREELKFRQAMRYPPIVSLINVVVRGRTFPAAMETAQDLAAALRSSPVGFRVLGPAPAPLARLKGEHRVQLFLKGAHRTAMRTALSAVLGSRPDWRRQVTVDVDPVSVL